ncbi:hypothetical protein CJF31_00011109 [Rutstroemia sp. NJR-2017a BVV2]|nr:hypothetical protein CJF31_00009213 [Rutstroemia sp. NJR-2017a BVV2]PQE21719.1 hypothetical protein CJF31_00011109 [Rutstroemia sp. NJR-2017a BVV2]
MVPCGKHISILKDAFTDEEEFIPDASFSFDFSSEIKILNPFTSTEQSKSSAAMLKSESHIKAGKALMHPFTATERDIAMFKRVVWQNYNE